MDILEDKLGFSPKTVRSGVVHRLDRDTSGVLILAKNQRAEEALKEIFKKRRIKKKYLVLVWGKVEPPVGEIRIPLGRGSKDRLRVVPSSRGRESVTAYKVKNYYPKADVSLVEVDLLTGRTHQIRVHFNAIGHPVVGDKKYSNRKSGPSRQFLHAEEISFTSPFSKETLKIKSALSDDLKKYLTSLN